MPEDGGDGVTVYACRHCEGVALDDRHRECCGEPMDPVTVDAAKEPDLATLVTQVFGVSETGVDICVLLMERDEVTIDDIAVALDVNRTTASRQLTQLRALGVIERREESLNDGGQRYVYTAPSIEAVRRRHQEALLSWVADAMVLLDELDEQKLAAVAEQQPKE
jgi:predicted transcriptional regulator